MNTRSVQIAVITAGLATAPMLSVAAKSPPAMDSCVKAFMASLSATMTKTPKLRESRLIDDRIGENSTEWTLMARDARTTITRSRVQCLQ